VAVTALALGMGANATVFTLTNAILFKGFPFDHSDRILYLNTKDANLPVDRFSGISYPDFGDWREQTRSFEGLAAWTGDRNPHYAHCADRTVNLLDGRMVSAA
jgi:putative ABC transport system permease protein